MDGGIRDGATPSTNEFARRFVNTLFRRWFVVLIPIALFGAIGIVAAGNIAPEFQSSASMSASENPLVAQPEIRGTTLNNFESPAAGTARLINEQLGTDSFVDDIAERSGLAEAIADGRLTRDRIRTRVRAGANGDNVMSVVATWGDSATATSLVESTVQAYLDDVAEIVATDSRDAIEFWQDQLEVAEGSVAAAELELDEYLATLPALLPGEDYSTAESLVIRRLDDSLARANDDVNDAVDGIRQAELTASQAETAAFQTIRIIDPASTPLEPEPSFMRKAIMVFMFLLIGLIAGLGAIALATAIDRSVSSAAQLARLAGTDTAVAVAHVNRRAKRRAVRPVSNGKKAA